MVNPNYDFDKHIPPWGKLPDKQTADIRPMPKPFNDYKGSSTMYDYINQNIYKHVKFFSIAEMKILFSFANLNTSALFNIKHLLISKKTPS